MIGVINYGLGNVSAFLTQYRRLNISAKAISHIDELAQAEKIILPGVGAFDEAMTRLHRSGMVEALQEAVLLQKKPVLGVCVGMQMMAELSEEGSLPGLGWMKAKVRRFAHSDLPLPHMGWNDVVPCERDRGGSSENNGKSLFTAIEEAQFYFLHSYFVEVDDPSDIAAESCYGRNFASSFHRDNLYGTQFHPEKSHEWGTRLLKNFAELP